MFFALLCILQAVGFVFALFNSASNFAADMLRPFVLMVFFNTLRRNIKEFWKDFLNAVTILSTIFIWVAIYSMVGFYLFRYSLSGMEFFYNFETSYVSMLTLLTTANFPDVMLPSYQINFFCMFFFVTYLIIGLFLLLNILLASVFNKFKERLA